MACFLVDYENVNSSGLVGITELAPDDTVYIFYTLKSGTLTFPAHLALMRAVAHVEYFFVQSGGKNALDFQLSTFLGSLVREGAEREYYIISNDMGFDFVKNFWNGREDSGNAGIKRTTTIRKAVQDIRSREMSTELEHDEIEHEAYVRSTAEADSNVNVISEASAVDMDFRAVAEAAIVEEITTAPETPKGIYIPNVPQPAKPDMNVSKEAEAEENKTSEIEEEKPVSDNSGKIVIDYGEFKEVFSPKEKNTSANTNSDVQSDDSGKRKNVGRKKKKADAEESKSVETKSETENEKGSESSDKLSAVKEKVKALNIEGITEKELNRVSEIVLKSKGKQDVYRAFISIFGMQRGGQLYSSVRPEFLNIKKSIEE